jgi:large subunit ribosomal protein L25
MELTIECQKRNPDSKPNALRRSGLIPAVLYGHDGANSLSLTIPAKAATTLVKKASLNNTLIQLKVTDVPWSGQALLREVQTHPWRGQLYHLSFYSVGTLDHLQATVPLHVVGEPVGVKVSGGILDTVLTDLEVQCPPGEIPEFIEVDVASLDIGDALHVNQLTLPPRVTALGEGDRVIVSVMRSRTAKDAESDATA